MKDTEKNMVKRAFSFNFQNGGSTIHHQKKKPFKRGKTSQSFQGRFTTQCSNKCE